MKNYEMKIPCKNSIVWDHVNIEDVVDAIRNHAYITKREAMKSAKKFFSYEPIAKFICYLVISGNDDLHLVKIGPRGGYKILWNFGNIPQIRANIMFDKQA